MRLDIQWVLYPSILSSEPNNVWCGLKHLGSLEYVNVPFVAVVDWTTNGCDASEERGAVCLMFGAFSHGIPRRCLVHRRQQLVAFEQQQLVDFLRIMPKSSRLWTRARSTCHAAQGVRRVHTRWLVPPLLLVTGAKQDPSRFFAYPPVLPTPCARPQLQSVL